MKIEDHNKRAARREKQWSEDLRAVLATPEGRRVLDRVMDRSKMMSREIFTGNSSTFYNLGQRDIGLWLYGEVMSAAPGSFIKMMQEKLEEFEK